jgi:hypothetical protein
MQKSRVKIMLTAFFDPNVSFIMNLCRKKQTVNGKFYKEIIRRSMDRVHCVRTEFQESGSSYLLHDNALAHSSGFVCEFLTKRGISFLSHPPNSPGSFPADIFYFLN